MGANIYICYHCVPHIPIYDGFDDTSGELAPILILLTLS